MKTHITIFPHLRMKPHARAFAALALLFSVQFALFAQATLTVPGGGNVTFSAGHATLTGAKAFDQGGTGSTDDSRWLADAGFMPYAYVTYSFKGPTVVNGYAVSRLSGGNADTRSPKSWSLEGSSDMEIWVPSDDQSEQTAWANNEIRRFETAFTNSFQHWRFRMLENNGAPDYVGVQELAYYGYSDYTEQPQVVALPYEQTGAGAVRLNGALTAGGYAYAFIAWGYAPGNLAYTNEVGKVSGGDAPGKFGAEVSGLADFTEYWYTIIATNDCDVAELPAPLSFTTSGPMFYWNRGSGGQWDDPANWNDASGAAGVAFPNAPGDIAVITNSTGTILIGQDVTVGELHMGVANSWNDTTFNISAPGAKIIFDNGTSPARLLHTHTSYGYPRFRTDWEIRNGLEIKNSGNPVYFYGEISGANTDIALTSNIFIWSPTEDTVYRGNLSSSGTGMFGKDGAANLTLADGTHSARFGSQYSEGDQGGVRAGSMITISGGTYSNMNNERPYIFANANGYFILTNGVHYFPSNGVTIGRTDKNSTNSTVIVTGDGTVWGGVQTIGVNRSNFIVRDGGRAEMGTVSLGSSGFVKISGVDPHTGTPAWMNLNGNALWIPQNGITPANRVEVSDGGVLSNGTVNLRAQYSGSTNSCIEVSNGGRVQTTLAIAQGGDQEGDVVGNHAIVTGADSMWIYPAAGTVQIGPRAPNARGVWHDRDNFVKVEKGGVFTNAAFNIGYCGNSNNQESFGNHLIVTDGGKVFSTLDSCIGQTQSTGANYSLMQGHYALVGGGEAESLWNLGGKNLRIGRSDGTNGWAVANHLEARSRGTVNDIATLYVGTNDAYANTNNFVRLAGGTVYTATLDVKKNNGIEVVVGADGTGIIEVGGTAMFSPGAFVRAFKTRESQPGRYTILRAAAIDDKGIALDNQLSLSPDTDPSIFKLLFTADGNISEIILKHSLPGTMLVVR